MHEVWSGPLSKASGQIHVSVWILMTQWSLIGLPETSSSVETLMAGTCPFERGLFNFWEGASVLENAWYLWDDCVSFTATCLLEPSWGGTHDLMNKDRDNRSPSVQNESSVWGVGRGNQVSFLLESRTPQVIFHVILVPLTLSPWPPFFPPNSAGGRAMHRGYWEWVVECSRCVSTGLDLLHEVWTTTYSLRTHFT